MTTAGVIIGTLAFLLWGAIKAVQMPPSLRKPYNPKDYL